jgi:hypothetical protein
MDDRLMGLAIQHSLRAVFSAVGLVRGRALTKVANARQRAFELAHWRRICRYIEAGDDLALATTYQLVKSRRLRARAAHEIVRRADWPRLAAVQALTLARSRGLIGYELPGGWDELFGASGPDLTEQRD